MHLSLYSMYVTMSISIGLYPNLDLWNANKLHYEEVRPLCMNQPYIHHQMYSAKRFLRLECKTVFKTGMNGLYN
jgi:hypothetical protein